MEKKEVSLEDLDPIFKQAYIEKDRGESDAKKPETSGKNKKPPSEKNGDDFKISDEDRYLLDLLGAYGGKKAAQMLDAGFSRVQEPSAPAVRGAEGSAAVQPRRAPAQAVSAFDQLFREGASGVASSPAPTSGMPTPVAGGPAGPVGGPATTSRQVGGSGVYNYGKAFDLTDIEAARALDMTKQAGGVHDLTTQRREGLGRVQQLFPNQFVENPRYGGIMTPQQGGGGVPRANFVQGPTGLTQIPVAAPISAMPPPPPAGPGPLSQTAGTVRRGTGAVFGSPITMGALGGLSLAESGQEAQQRMAAGDTTGAAIAGAGGVGGVMQMMPNQKLRALGAVVSAASPLTQYLRDKFRSASQAPMSEPTPAELLEAQTPAFRYARP